MPASPPPTEQSPPATSSQERSVPSLLPAFEPTSFSPTLPRLKRWPTNASPKKRVGHGLDLTRYPTPLPSSSTLVPSSSPPQPPPERRRRAPLTRTCSTLSERAPLATLATIELSEDGEPTLMGRSSNSSHYQLSTNKLISRVHVRACYIAPKTPNDLKKIQIECAGWNGVKVHCQNRAWELMKGDTFTSETEGADIMLDVHDARVMIKWPQATDNGKTLTPTDSGGSSWEGDNSPTRRRVTLGSGRAGNSHPNSPLRREHRLQSPVSPSPATQVNAAGQAAANPAGPPMVQIYEDEPSDEDKEKDGEPTQQTQCSTQIASQGLLKAKGLQDSFASQQDFSDNDEENDPIITSFGPFGENLDARLGNISTFSPPIPARSSSRRAFGEVQGEATSPQGQASFVRSPKRRRLDGSFQEVSAAPVDHSEWKEAIKNHVINQLAYSALSATPLSTIFESMPADLRTGVSMVEAPAKKTEESKEASVDGSKDSVKKTKYVLTHESLEQQLRSVPCIGAVQRSGKDAAGKRLESEFYYVLEKDDDEKRREVVMGMGGRGLRNCRKSHKQYFWRKPK